MAPAAFRPLGPIEKDWLATFVHRLIPTAADPSHSMQRVAATQISLSMWRWTADGINEKGVVVPDAIKYDPRFLPATRAAKAAIEQSELKGLRHEHVVPRRMLTEHFIAQYRIERVPQYSVEQLVDVLQKYCLGVIVTSEEDRRLVRGAMPTGWSFEGGDVFARYHAAGLAEAVCYPSTS